MNLDYLQSVIIPQRQKEIEKGDNLGTRQPIYVVMDIRSHVADGHSDYINKTTNLKGKNPVYGFIDLGLEPECREIKETPENMEKPEEITEFYTDQPVAFFLTSKAANEYMQYQKHNLTHDAYVYVFYSGYRNIEMDKLLKGN